MANQMTLSECAKWDWEHKARTTLTGWGIICKEREKKGISRKAKRLAKQKN